MFFINLCHTTLSQKVSTTGPPIILLDTSFNKVEFNTSVPFFYANKKDTIWQMNSLKVYKVSP